MGRIAEAHKDDASSERTAQVVIVMNPALSQERDAIMAEIKDAAADKDQRLGQAGPMAKLKKKLAEIEARELEGAHTLEFKRVNNMAWSELVAENPPRENSLMDNETYGFNFDAVTRAAAEFHSEACEVLTDGTRQPLDADDWAVIWKRISPAEANYLVNRILDLNVFAPTRDRERLKKALAATAASDAK